MNMMIIFKETQMRKLIVIVLALSLLVVLWAVTGWSIGACKKIDKGQPFHFRCVSIEMILDSWRSPE